MHIIWTEKAKTDYWKNIEFLEKRMDIKRRLQFYRENRESNPVVKQTKFNI